MSRPWNISDFLDDLSSRGDAPALMALRDGKLIALSGQDLAKSARGLACGLLEMGMVPGEAVALIGPSGFEWVVARLGLAAANALSVAIDELASDADVQATLVQSNVRFAICHAAHAEALCQSNRALHIVVFGNGPLPEGARHFEALLRSRQYDLPAAPASAKTMLAYTSGTTGAPKAIVLTNENLGANIAALVASRLVGPADRVLLPLPLQHVYPLVVGLFAPLGSGATVVFPEGTTGPQLLEAIRVAEISAIVGVPRLYSAICSGLMARIDSANLISRITFSCLLKLSTWLRRTFAVNAGRQLFSGIRARFGTRLRLLVSGGARLESETLWTLVGLGFDVRSGYGLAETASCITANMPGAECWESEGAAIAGGRVRISDPGETGDGEIQLKGPQVFSGYLDNPQATQSSFTEDGWFRSGDIGHLDRRGFLHVTGRAKDTIVLGSGKKINPEELEAVYAASRYIQEVAILERRGSLVALVVPSPDATRTGSTIHVDTAVRVDLTSIGRELPSHQQLSGFVITRRPLPRTRLGKYRRFLLAEIYERELQHTPPEETAPLSPEDKTLLMNPVASQVYDIISRRRPERPIALDANPLLDLGIDSLEWVSLGLELEDRLKIRLAEDEIANVATIRDLLETAAKASPSPASSEPGCLNWIGPVGPGFELFAAMLYALDRSIMRMLFRQTCKGRENVPQKGNFILIANHASYLDPMVIGAALSLRTLRRCYWAGDPGLLFSRPWKRLFMRAMHVFPIDERRPGETLAVAEMLLKRGDSIVWFPEGWRSPDGQLQPFLPGIGYLLLKCPVVVLPVHIAGSFESLPRHRRLPVFRRIRVTIGRPILPADWQNLRASANEASQKIVDMLHQVINALPLENIQPKV